MFTGIIEELGEVTELVKDKDNLHITVKSALSKELKIDQSLAHNGVCLTVVVINQNTLINFGLYQMYSIVLTFVNSYFFDYLNKSLIV